MKQKPINQNQQFFLEEYEKDLPTPTYVNNDYLNENDEEILDEDINDVNKLLEMDELDELNEMKTTESNEDQLEKKKGRKSNDENLSEETLKRRENDTLRKRRTIMNSKKDEACIIGLMAYYTKITLRRSTLKQSPDLEHFVIEGVENKTIQTTVDRLYEEYLNAISGLKRDINARNIHQSHQNIYFNCFIDYLKQSGNDVTFCASKQGQYMINRKRFKTFNGRSQYDCRQFGEAMNYHIQSLIPIDKSKKDGKIVLSRDDILIIFCQYPMCTPSLSRRQSNN